MGWVGRDAMFAVSRSLGPETRVGIKTWFEGHDSNSAGSYDQHTSLVTTLCRMSHSRATIEQRASVSILGNHSNEIGTKKGLSSAVVQRN